MEKARLNKKKGSNSRLNIIYNNMKTRCCDPKNWHYKYYGARGITICDEWKNEEKVPSLDNASKGYLAFKKWALANGYKDTLTIDRIDVNKGYSPDNCRWATKKTQANNTRRNRFITYKNKTQTLAEWCDELGLKYDAVERRLNQLHWTIKEAFEGRVDQRIKMVNINGKTQPLRVWCKELGLNHRTVYSRLHRGWSVEKALEII